MLLKYEPEIVSDQEFWIDYPTFGSAMQSKKDMTLVIKGAGGNTGAGDVTMGISVYGDIDPQDHDDNGSPVDISAWTNLTPAVFRVDQNAAVATPTVDFTGPTETTAFLDLDNLNADRLKFRVTFTGGVPILATPAKLLVKLRKDNT